MTLVFSSNPSRLRIEAAGHAFEGRKVQSAKVQARRTRQALGAIDRARREEREVRMARAARISEQRLYDGLIGPSRATMREIVEAVSLRTGITVHDILSSRRQKMVALARHECFWLCREGTLHSFPVIGRFFHRDHTTVMSGCRKHELRMAREVAAA